MSVLIKQKKYISFIKKNFRYQYKHLNLSQLIKRNTKNVTEGMNCAMNKTADIRVLMSTVGTFEGIFSKQ